MRESYNNIEHEKTLAQQEFNKIADQTRKEKFIMFLVGLTFAILSFLTLHPSYQKGLFFKVFDSIALLFLFLAGVLWIVQLGKFFWIPKKQENLSARKVKVINYVNIKILANIKVAWLCFLIGVFFIMISRIISFYC